MRAAPAPHMARERSTRRNLRPWTRGQSAIDLPNTLKSMSLTSSSSCVHDMQASSWHAGPTACDSRSVSCCITFFVTWVEIFLRSRHSSCVMGASVSPTARGCEHSLGKAWCIHCSNNLPCNGTYPSCCSAIVSSFQRRDLERFRGAATVSDDKASTSSMIKPGDATG
eukprot:CAMPEP_0115209052 /NCGR_PEP_ID=MMETSP0270-20121206/21539_1 /TAXON_ID=71861 /ORGANISM="Scrippsiella trochoidea, Strain CCMP3099" /LENGTH=167 /DNA_ID=CAMNT_0002622677 /DNA_START=55 /DNA_END=558 /DNA_ORIENTATION=+